MFNMFKRYKEKKRKQQELLIKWIANETKYEVIHEMIAVIGLDELEKIVEQGKKNRGIDGHSNYTNLAKLYIKLQNK